MTKEEFFEELEEATHAKEKLVDKVKSLNLPVILFGAGGYAVEVTKILNKYGLEVSGYAVDEEYYQPNKIFLNRPVYNFAELYRKPKEQVFFNAMFVAESNSAIEFRRWELVTDDNIIVYEFLSPAFSCEMITYEFISENKDKLWETYNMLSDDLSKKTMLVYLKSHISRIASKDLVMTTSKEYFNEFTASAICGGGGGIFVDCGAYTGDTVKNFIDFVDGKYEKIFALEPDKENFVKLKKFIEDKNYENVFLFNCGAWNERSEQSFLNLGAMGSQILSNEVAEKYETIRINTDTIDNIVGDTHVDLIKMDIEGAELNALKGAVKTLKNSRPALALSAYHRKEDLITLPQFAKNIYGSCKFYFRRYHAYSLFEFDLYVIPE